MILDTHMTAHDYHARPEVSNSRLKLVSGTLLDFLHERQKPKGPSEAMQFGSAVHTIILEPDNFQKDF